MSVNETEKDGSYTCNYCFDRILFKADLYFRCLVYVPQPHAFQSHAFQPHAFQSHASQPHAFQPHAFQSHASQPHAFQPHAFQPHAFQLLISLEQCFSKWSGPGGVEEMQGGGRRVRLEWGAYITV
ncbi:hypothetical protein FHG87_019137 [Trinorchestia longiramus]|nr:hypothetical protein FHG87_019137 [Trinorchestia longiramus]